MELVNVQLVNINVLNAVFNYLIYYCIEKKMIGFDIESGEEKEFNLADCITANYDKFRLMYFLFYTSASIGKLELVAPSNIGSEEFKNETKDQSKKSKQKSLEILEKLPISDTILDWCKKGNEILKQELNVLHPMSYNLLSWCMTYQSNHIIELKGKSAIPHCNASIFFINSILNSLSILN